MLATPQQQLPSGRSDLVFIAGDDLLLVELRAEPATEAHVEQLARYVRVYKNELIGTEFPAGYTLRPFLLAPEISATVETDCESTDIEPVVYSIGVVFEQHHEYLLAELDMFEVGGIVTRVARLGLLNGFGRYLDDHSTPVSLATCAEHYNVIGKGGIATAGG